MKALTLTQPWATLIALGKKRVETRSWFTMYRGPLAIHASKNLPLEARELSCREPFCSTLTQHGFVDYKQLPLGNVIAVCELAAVREILSVHVARKMLGWKWLNLRDGVEYEFELTDLEMAFGEYGPGRYAWLLHNVVRLAEPIPAKGMLGLWEWNGGG